MRENNHRLVVKARRLLCRHLDLEAPCPEPMLGAMATLPLPERFQSRSRSGKIETEQLDLYDEFGIEVALLRFGQPERRWFRISAQVYNTKQEYEYLAEAIDCVS